MKRKIKQKGFIQIPLLIGIIISLVTVSALTTGVILHKQGKSFLLVANVSEIFKGTEDAEPAVKSEEPKKEQEQSLLEETNQKEDSQIQTEKELERVKLESEKAQTEAEKAKQEAEQEAQRIAEEEAQAEVERAKQETERAKAETERLKAEQELEQAKLEAEKAQAEAEKAKQEAEQSKAETERLKAEQEAQRIAEEEQEQKELERKEAEEARIAAEKEARQEAEEERQQQQEYSYYIQKLNTIKSNLLNKKPSITLVLGQIDALYEQDMNKVISDYEDKLAQAQKSYQSELNEMAEYYASRGLTFSSARTTAEAELLANYNSYIKGLENEYLQYLANTDTYYVKKEEDLKDSLNNIDSKIKDIDYLVSKLQQQILSEVDKILLNKALTY